MITRAQYLHLQGNEGHMLRWAHSVIFVLASLAAVGCADGASTANGDFYVGNGGMTLAEAQQSRDTLFPKVRKLLEDIGAGRTPILMLLPSGECGAVVFGCLLYNSLPQSLRQAALGNFARYATRMAEGMDPANAKVQIVFTDKPISDSRSLLAATKRVQPDSEEATILLRYDLMPHSEALVESLIHELFHYASGKDDRDPGREREFDTGGRFFVKCLERTEAENASRPPTTP